jgi:transcriptional regulator with XRE-family HTH domain
MSEKETLTFGMRVREVRKRLKLTQEEFGGRFGITIQNVSSIEKDKSRPGFDFFYNIVKNYQVNLYYLLFGEGEMFLGEEAREWGEPKQIKTGNPADDEFLHYFFNSVEVKYHVMYIFSRLMGDEGEDIRRRMKNPPQKDEESKTHEKK